MTNKTTKQFQMVDIWPMLTVELIIEKLNRQLSVSVSQTKQNLTQA